MAYNPYMMMSGAANLASGLFGNSGDPYSQAAGQYEKYADQAASYQEPFYNAGKQAIPEYQDWLKSMQDPSAFINELMGDYSMSPWAQYEQQQSMNAATNQASASGLSGSTPMQLQSQQNASNIASQDMQQWLNNVLGINTQYGQGQQYMTGMGAQSANSLSNIYSNLGRQMATTSYGQRAGQQQDQMDELMGLASIGMAFL